MFDSYYVIAGSGGDVMNSTIYVNTTATIGGTQIFEKVQQFTNASGGGTRSGTLLPITGLYENTNTSDKYFILCLKTSQVTDTITFVQSNNIYNIVKINEYSA